MEQFPRTGFQTVRLLATLVLLLGPRPGFGQRDLSGVAQTKLALDKLNVLGSVLMIAAHPDDENTALLAYLARGRHLRTAYLSATRGEGGQNLIGPEQGDALGLIRTQELLAARRIDGAEQFFTRAIDFGFSKSVEETLAKWGREETLADMVWVIRRYRPDVIVLRFSGTPRDGHGQHQASAILGKEAFFAAADRSRFPEQLPWVEPWRAERLLFNVFSFSPEQEKQAEQTPGRLVLDTGEYDPALGKSYTEIAGMSRSMHRSQGMGAPQRRGVSHSYLVNIAGTKAGNDPFDGIETTWNRLPGGSAVGRILSEAAATFSLEHPEKTVPLLLKARPLIAAMRNPLATIKLAELDEAIALCTGLWLDAEAERYAVTPGASVKVALTALNRSHLPINLIGVRLEGMGTSTALDGTSAALRYNMASESSTLVRIPIDAPYSQPFWLQKPKNGARYTIEKQQLIGLADNPALLEARFKLLLGDTVIELSRPVRYRYVDPLQGELIRPLAVVPPVAVNLPERVLVFPNNTHRTVRVELRANVSGATGTLSLGLEKGWTAEPSSRQFSLTEPGELADLRFEVTPPAADALARLQAAALDKTGRTSSTSGMEIIAHPHIPPQTIFPASQANLVRADIQLASKRVGYVMGAGDEMPRALAQLGCSVTLLSAEDLASRDLYEFDAIVTGVRAYNVRPDLRAHQQRLLRYVDGGGTLIVQYNVIDDNDALAKIGPYPIRIGRGRVTVEEAPVIFPNPEHRLLRAPNRITAHDFEGWVQERGLYFASEWDPHYEPVLESHDPGEKPLLGGMLYTTYGKGVYIFSAYSWFRQLPAGVPGACRVFANMLSAGQMARTKSLR